MCLQTSQWWTKTCFQATNTRCGIMVSDSYRFFLSMACMAGINKNKELHLLVCDPFAASWVQSFRCLPCRFYSLHLAPLRNDVLLMFTPKTHLSCFIYARCSSDCAEHALQRGRDEERFTHFVWRITGLKYVALSCFYDCPARFICGGDAFNAAIVTHASCVLVYLEKYVKYAIFREI